MSVYPKTEDFREAWIDNGGEPREFDQWLRSVKAIVWEGGYNAGRYVKKHRNRGITAANPYQEQEEDT